MKFLKKIASASEAVQTDVNVLYATDTGVKLVKPLPTYTVTFKDYDDSVISTKVYKQGETVTVPSNPTREGYDFTGWSPTVSPTAVADAVYTAQYEEAKPTVETVDLGLPSGTLWMKYNIGASTETEYGKFFQWGDTVGYDDASHSTWLTTPFNNGASEYDSAYFASVKDDVCPNGALAAQYDAASVATNGVAHMPTPDDFNELKVNTTITWETDFNGSGVSGRKFTASNGNYIFIPTSGYASYDRVGGRGSNGSVWSSSLYADGPGNAWYLNFSSRGVGVYNGNCYNGYSVRGVVSKN